MRTEKKRRRADDRTDENEKMREGDEYGFNSLP
jgi:hypothetical protein